MNSPLSNIDKIKLYLIEKVQRNFGTNSVTRVVDIARGVRIEFYPIPVSKKDVPQYDSQEEIVKKVEGVFPSSLFDNNAENTIFSRIALKGTGDEQIVHLDVYGGTPKEIKENVERNDPVVFADAQNSTRAQEILQRGKQSTARPGMQKH